MKTSKGHVVVEIVGKAAPSTAAGRGAATARAAAKAGRSSAEILIAAEIVALAATAAKAAATRSATRRAVEHRQHRVEALQHDLGRIFVLTLGILPFAGLQCA